MSLVLDAALLPPNNAFTHSMLNHVFTLWFELGLVNFNDHWLLLLSWTLLLALLIGQLSLRMQRMLVRREDFLLRTWDGLLFHF